MAVCAAASCNVALGRPFLLHTGPITNYCHTWLDFRHITIAAHQDPCHRGLSVLAAIGPSPPGRNNLVCTEDELGPWPHERGGLNAAYMSAGSAPNDCTDGVLKLWWNDFSCMRSRRCPGWLSGLLRWVAWQALPCPARPFTASTRDRTPSTREVLEILPGLLLHRYARLHFFLNQSMSSAFPFPFPIAGSGWQREGAPLVCGDLRTAAALCCWANCRPRLGDAVVPS